MRETAQESRSLAKRLARAYYDWLYDEQRRERWFEPIGLVLFAVIAGITIVIAANLLLGLADVGNEDAWPRSLGLCG